MTRYAFSRIRGQTPLGELGEATVHGWGAQPLVDALVVLLEQTEGAATEGVYKYRNADDETGLDGGRIRLSGKDARVLMP